ncbi:MAG: hypothetical protein ACI8SK_001259, partial [Shewanella sp.]
MSVFWQNAHAHLINHYLSRTLGKSLIHKYSIREGRKKRAHLTEKRA